MLELKDVSASYVYYSKDIDNNIRDVLEKNNFKTSMSVQDVINLMDENPEMNWQEAKKRIAFIQKCIDRTNLKRETPEIYSTDGYSDKSLEYVDELNDGNVLLRCDPTNLSDLRTYKLGLYTVSEIKNMLKYTSTSGKNYLDDRIKKVGKAENILTWLDMYERQIERQALLTNDRTINLFEYNLEEKSAIVRDKLYDIILYLINNTEEKLVWGEFDNTRKRLLFDATISNSKDYKEMRDNIVYYISSYTTLPELEKLTVNNPKVLKRFIVK